MADANLYTSSISSLSSFSLTPEKSTKRRRISKKALEQELREQQEREARQREEDESRAEAVEYIQDFLDDSEWSDRMDFISIIHDAVPTLDELLGFGCLDAQEGTKACRKLFKAVVIWEELGRGLWEKLSAAAAEAADAASSSSDDELDDGASTMVPESASSRRTSQDSSCSRASFWSTLSRSNTTASMASTVSTTSTTTALFAEKPAKKSRVNLPGIISGHCASALRRTWGRLSDRAVAGHARGTLVY